MHCSMNTLTLLGILPLAIAAGPSNYRMVTKGTGGIFGFNGGPIGTDSCNNGACFFVNLLAPGAGAYVAHVENDATTWGPFPDSNVFPIYKEVAAKVQRIFRLSKVTGWNVSSAYFSTTGDLGFAHAVRDGVMSAIGGNASNAHFDPLSDGFVVSVRATNANNTYLPLLPPTQFNTQRKQHMWNQTNVTGNVTWKIGNS